MCVSEFRLPKIVDQTQLFVALWVFPPSPMSRLNGEMLASTSDSMIYDYYSQTLKSVGAYLSDNFSVCVRCDRVCLCDK